MTRPLGGRFLAAPAVAVLLGASGCSDGPASGRGEASGMGGTGGPWVAPSTGGVAGQLEGEGGLAGGAAGVVAGGAESDGGVGVAGDGAGGSRVSVAGSGGTVAAGGGSAPNAGSGGTVTAGSGPVSLAGSAGAAATGGRAGAGGSSPGVAGAGATAGTTSAGPFDMAWYLSDLCDTGDATNAWGPYERDLSNGEDGERDGGPIIIGDTVYSRGLGMHAPADVEFQLGGACASFFAAVGIDREMKAAGSVSFEVWGDGVLLEQTASLLGYAAAVPIEVDVSGVEQLRLVANPGDDEGSDHADWANARLLCNTLPPSDCAPTPATIPVPSGYELAWSDEFSSDGPADSSNWSFERGFVRNEELQWYQEDNTWAEAGFLIIEGRQEAFDLSGEDRSGWKSWAQGRQHAEYTSSSLHTRGKHSWQYGRFEMRARLVAEGGLWPAYWTLGIDGQWPWNGEIDILEYYQNNVHANFAVGTETDWVGRWDSWSEPVSSLGVEDWDSKFHVWRMDWDAQAACLYLDDREVNCTSLDDMLNPDGSSPFRQPHYVLVNLAIGGTGGGAVPASTVFPTFYIIDYVRVFQQP